MKVLLFYREKIIDYCAYKEIALANSLISLEQPLIFGSIFSSQILQLTAKRIGKANARIEYFRKRFLCRVIGMLVT
jgi:hypothetical protein